VWLRQMISSGIWPSQLVLDSDSILLIDATLGSLKQLAGIKPGQLHTGL
jgi:hypothetical protein